MWLIFLFFFVFFWFLFFGFWFLVFGFWFLVFGFLFEFVFVFDFDFDFDRYWVGFYRNKRCKLATGLSHESSTFRKFVINLYGKWKERESSTLTWKEQKSETCSQHCGSNSDSILDAGIDFAKATQPWMMIALKELRKLCSFNISIGGRISTKDVSETSPVVRAS